MEKYYVRLKGIDPIFYTNYILDHFIPNRKFHESLPSDKPYIIYYDCMKDNIINHLSTYLIQNYSFPQISHMSIFKHTVPQHIHIDGGPSHHQYASLNLPLQNYEDTTMYFYEIKEQTKKSSTDAHYFDISNLKLTCELRGSNDWVLVNAGVPHNVSSKNYEKPRITLCIRFIDNPKFEQLASKIIYTGGPKG